MSTVPGSQAHAEARSWGVLPLLALACGPVVSMVDSSAVNVAVPDLATEMNAPLAHAGWVVSAYLLGIAAALPVTVWLAARWGTRRVYVAALVAFAAASAGCAAAPDVAALVGARALQGVAGAPLVPLALTLLFRGGTTRRRPPMVAGVLFFLAPALGPSVGALLTDLASWRLIFLINLPIVAFGLLAMPGSADLPAPPPAVPPPPDILGVMVLAAGSLLCTVAAAHLTPTGWHSPEFVVPLALGAAGLAAYLVHQRRHPHPAVSLALLPDRYGRVAVSVCVLASVVLFAMLFLIPVYVEAELRRPAVDAGLLLLPQGIAVGVFSGLGERWVDVWGLRRTVLRGMLLLTGTTAALLLVDPGTPLWVLALLLTGRGAALGLSLQPLVVGMMSRSDPTHLTDVSTMFTILQRIGGSLGVAAVAAYYQGHAAGSAPFKHTMWLLVALAAVGAALATRLPRRSPTGPVHVGVART